MSTETTTTTTDETTGPERVKRERIIPPPPEPTPPRRGLLRRVRHPATTGPLTDEAAADLATRVSDDPVPLPDESAAPCRACGVAVPVTPTTPTERRDLTIGRRTWRQTFARCPDCSTRHDLAAALVAAHPALSARYGSVIGGRVEAALVVLAVLGIAAPAPETTTRADAERLLRFLAVPGSAVSWMTRAENAPGHAAPYPFAHVRETDRSGLRSAYASLLRDRLSLSSEPVALAPPPIPADPPTSGTIPAHGGCLMCGLAAVTLSAVAVARAGGRDLAARKVWTLRRVSPESLGGRRSPTPLAGHLCPDCNAAAVHVGALGPSALERSLTHFLGLGGKWTEGSDALAGLVGWGALVADAHHRGTEPPPPNRTRWAHVGADNLDGIARDLSRRG